MRTQSAIIKMVTGCANSPSDRSNKPIVTKFDPRESPVDPGRGNRGAETSEITAGSVFGILSNLAATTLRHFEIDRLMDPLWLILRFLLGPVGDGHGTVSGGGVLAEVGYCFPPAAKRTLRPFYGAGGMRVRPGWTWFGRPRECVCVAPVARLDQRGPRLDRFTSGLAGPPPVGCRNSSAPDSLLPRGG